MINGISLFANVGIDEYYFKNNNVQIKVSNELIGKRADFYKNIYPESNMICGDITETKVFDELIRQYKLNNCEFLIATPPCQGMSIAGRMDQSDERNKLITYVVDFCRKTEPNNIIIENVPGLLKFKIDINGTKKLIKDYIVESFEELGYHINFDVLDAADYGTPQHRKRAIFLISKFKKWEMPDKMRKISVREAIGDLPSLEPGEKSSFPNHYGKNHNDRHVTWMRNTPTGKSAHQNLIHFPKLENGKKITGYSTTYKRIDWDKPSPTITMANGSISSQNNVHPGKLKVDGTYSDPRVLSILELIRLTGLPDNWEIPDWATETLIRQVLGESFPPRFAESLLKKMPRKK